MLDTLIRGGWVIDGTGRERNETDVAIRDGRIVGIGATDEPAHHTLDARGRVVAPAPRGDQVRHHESAAQGVIHGQRGISHAGYAADHIEQGGIEALNLRPVGEA